MKEEIAKTDIPREKGFLYYLGTSEQGTLVIFRSKAGRKKKE